MGALSICNCVLHLGCMSDAKGEMRVFRPDGKVLREFVRCRGFVQVIQGPWGSGKTGTCCVGKVWNYATQMAPSKDGIRRSRWFVVRNTYTDLKNTTLKTWKDWFPESVYGPITMSRPFSHHIKIGDVDLEVLFLALDDEDDRKKLLSLECTGIYFNEMREIEKGIIDDATGRVGRFPGIIYKPDDVPKDQWPSWYGVIGDTNAPHEEHWIPIMRGDVPPPDYFTDDDIREHAKPDNWFFFMQPPAMVREYDANNMHVGYKVNPVAENLAYLPNEYYENMIKGKKPSWILVNVLNELGRLVEGKPVFETFREDVHVSKEKLFPVEGQPLYVGIDFGRQPAAVIGQHIRGQWRILHEYMGYDMGADRYAPLLKKELAGKFPGFQYAMFGDPAGDDANQSGDNTPYRIFRAHGMTVLPAYMNNKLSIRLESVEHVLGRNNDDNSGPGLLLDPSCKIMAAALNGGYQFKRLKVSGGARYSDVPDKNKYSHPADAFQYLLLGGGEGRAILNQAAGSRRPIQRQRRNINTRRRARA